MHDSTGQNQIAAACFVIAMVLALQLGIKMDHKSSERNFLVLVAGACFISVILNILGVVGNA